AVRAAVRHPREPRGRGGLRDNVPEPGRRRPPGKARHAHPLPRRGAQLRGARAQPHPPALLLGQGGREHRVALPRPVGRKAGVSPARPRRERPAARLIVPAAIEVGALAALAALVLLASPDSTRLWAVNGFRSAAPEARLLLVLLAGGAAF